MLVDFSLNTLVIPASLSGDRMLLTDPNLIEAVRALAVYATSDPDHQIPHPGQMSKLLHRFNETPGLDNLVTDRFPANPDQTPFSYTNDEETDIDNDIYVNGPFAMATAINEDGSFDRQPYEIAMTNGFALKEISSDVEDEEMVVDNELALGPLVSIPAPSSPLISEPSLTPVPATTAPSGRIGFLSGVKNILTSPLKRLGFVATTDVNFSPNEPRDPTTPTPYNKLAHKRMVSRKNASALKAQKMEAARTKGATDGDIHRAQRHKKRISNEKTRARTSQSGESSASPAPGEKRKGTYSVPEMDWSSSDGEASESQNDESPSIDSRTVGSRSSAGRPRNYRKVSDGYNGTLFQQPASIQANINEGRPYLAERTDGTLALINNRSASGNVFSSSTTSNIPKEAEVTLDNSTSPQSSKTVWRKYCIEGLLTNGLVVIPDPNYNAAESEKDKAEKEHSGTYSYPEYSSDEDTEDTEEGSPTQTLQSTTDGRNEPRQTLNGGSVVAGSSSGQSTQTRHSTTDGRNGPRQATNGVQTMTDGRNGPRQTLNGGSVVEVASSGQPAQSGTTVLTEKNWQQSAPPKPRPANATLPMPKLPPSFAKYVPEKPTPLRVCKNMSPMQTNNGSGSAPDENASFDAADDLKSPKQADSEISMGDASPVYIRLVRILEHDMEKVASELKDGKIGGEQLASRNELGMKHGGNGSEQITASNEAEVDNAGENDFEDEESVDGAQFLDSEVVSAVDSLSEDYF